MMNNSATVRCACAATLAIVALAGCSIGQLASRKMVDPYDVPATMPASLPPLPASGIPAPAIARSCRAGSAPLAAVRPGVGALLNLTVWSSGIMPEINPGRGNAGPPPVDDMPVALRMVAVGDRLDAAEQRVLGTFLITNRDSWHTVGEGAGTVRERLELAAAVREHQAALWNALVGSLCIEVWENAPLRESTDAPGRGRTLIVLADMASLCRALPAARRDDFARAFLDNASSCAQPVYKGLAGLLDVPARSDWAAGALDVGTHSGAARYYAVKEQATTMVLGGVVSLNSVRPQSPDAPNWSLAAWEASGICYGADGVRTRILSLLLIGGTRTIDVIDPSDARKPTYRVVNDGVSTQLEKISDNWLFPAIDRADLSRLSRADVRQLNWTTAAAGVYSRPVEPAGCVHIR